jgi:tetratricopeptide (TPR) repeat protein
MIEALFLKHWEFHTEPGVLVVRIGQNLPDLNAVGHTGREAFLEPWLLISVKTFHSLFNLLLEFYAESSWLAANETSLRQQRCLRGRRFPLPSDHSIDESQPHFAVSVGDGRLLAFAHHHSRGRRLPEQRKGTHCPRAHRQGGRRESLREVCGLTAEEIAKAFLITPRTLAQRIVRAKAKIRETPIPYEVPTPEELPERLGAVLQVIYLVFNEGYSAAAGAEVTRAELTAEAIRLGRLVSELQPEPEVIGLLSLMLLQESRRAARTSPTGELILLENQDRSLWNREQIAEGVALLEKALKSRRFGSYTLQAAIAAVHAEAESVAATDWQQIVALYNRLLQIQPSPVVRLNRAVAIAMRDGPEAGLTHIDAVLEHGELANYYLAHSARADMYRRLGRTAEARSSYEKALALTQQEPERQFLQERIRQLK